MSKFPNTVSKITGSSNSRQVSSAPKKSQEAESLRLFHRGDICIAATEGLLKFALIDVDS